METPAVYGKVRYIPSQSKVTIGEKEIALTRTEGLVLQQLMRNVGRVVTYASLAQALWGDYYPGAHHALNVYIRRLRQKIEENPARPEIIHNKPGVGYFLAKPES